MVNERALSTTQEEHMWHLLGLQSTERRAEQAYESIAALELAPLVQLALEKGWLTEADQKEASAEYRHFLYLVWRHNLWSKQAECHSDHIVPTELADQLWHAHLLHNLNYNKFCITVFGKIIGHYPGLTVGSREMDRALFQTYIIDEGASHRFVNNYCYRLGIRVSEDSDRTARAVEHDTGAVMIIGAAGTATPDSGPSGDGGGGDGGAASCGGAGCGAS